ncbi:MAG: DUF1284 domain-containing protein [Armatimonadetes bacterium]|jgi:hypothetical protein|nr:DUF1284 domain-containing protein [Armatimonadota bacterium]
MNDIYSANDAKARYNDEVFELRAHHLLCAVCAAAGAKRPPCGTDVTDAIRKAIASHPFMQLKLTADIDLVRSHYLDIDSNCHSRLPDNFFSRRADYVNRAKDLELLCRLDIRPNTIHPAIDVVRLLFLKVESLKGICYQDFETSSEWPECEYARTDHYKQTREKGGPRCYSMDVCWDLGEELAGCGPYSLLPIRTKEEVRKAKLESCRRIEQAERLFIRPHHLMCLMCHYGLGDIENPLNVDNLHEVLVKMRDNPDIPVTLSEGCCMICDPCPAYDPEKHLCHWIYTRDQLKDLRVLQKLGLKPGDTLKARELLDMLTEKIKTTGEICGPDVSVPESYIWAPCSSSVTGRYEKALNKGIFNK